MPVAARRDSQTSNGLLLAEQPDDPQDSVGGALLEGRSTSCVCCRDGGRVCSGAGAFECRSRRARGAGADGSDLQAQDESWKLASWFKLLLHPPTMAPSTRSAPATTSESEDHFETHELPFGVTVEQVYAEYLGYLWKHTQAWFEETTAKCAFLQLSSVPADLKPFPSGDKIWAKLSGTSTIVMSHPDGWNDSQQAVLESALVRAGFVVVCSTRRPR